MNLHIPSEQIGARRACVVIPDGTRELPLESLLARCLEQLTAGGAARIEVIVALGLHRPMTAQELAALSRICEHFGAELLQHSAHDLGVLRTLSRDIGLLPHRDGLHRALPVTLHRAVCDAELIVCIGVIEPHQYAGFSGGVKGIAIGCAGADTIAALHGLEYLRDPNTTLGVLAHNPFREALGRVSSCLSAPIYGIHYVPATSQVSAEIVCGEVHEAFARASEIASRRFFVLHDTPVSWTHIKVDGPKGVNFYQASRAATYVGLVARPIVKPGGLIILDAPCPEGMGEGAGERACSNMLARGLDTLLAELEGRAHVPEATPLSGGAQRAYVIARLLARYRLILIGAPTPLRGLAPHLVPQLNTLSEALAHHGLNRDEGCTLEDVFHAVPSLSNP